MRPSSTTKTTETPYYRITTVDNAELFANLHTPSIKRSLRINYRATGRLHPPLHCLPFHRLAPHPQHVPGHVESGPRRRKSSILRHSPRPSHAPLVTESTHVQRKLIESAERKTNLFPREACRRLANGRRRRPRRSVSSCCRVYDVRGRTYFPLVRGLINNLPHLLEAAGWFEGGDRTERQGYRSEPFGRAVC